MNKIIFLDIDGVLNSQKWYDFYISNEMYKDKSKDFDLDPSAIELLNSILEEVPSVRIVVSSTWRYDIDDTIDRLKAQGLKIPVIGKTSVKVHEDQYMPRGVLVKKWIDEHICSDTCNYVILDDDTDFLIDQANNFIKTSSSEGITEDNVKRAIGILGRDIKRSNPNQTQNPSI